VPISHADDCRNVRGRHSGSTHIRDYSIPVIPVNLAAVRWPEDFATEVLAQLHGVIPSQYAHQLVPQSEALNGRHVEDDFRLLRAGIALVTAFTSRQLPHEIQRTFTPNHVS
jgi:hypothetical protein